jgi:hypothetical protein
MLLYKRSGEPVEAVLWVLPIQNVALGTANVAAVCIANVTAARCKRVERLTLGRMLGSGAFGRVHIGTLLLSDVATILHIFNIFFVAVSSYTVSVHYHSDVCIS